MVEPGIYAISSQDYHHAPEYRVLSNGGMGQLAKTPAHLWASWLHPKEATPAMIFGILAHLYMLEFDTFYKKVALEPEMDKRTKAGKFAWASFLDTLNNRMIIKEDDMAKLVHMREALLENETAKNLLKSGDTEQSVFWNDPTHGFLCKARPDFVTKIDDYNIIIDYKTAADASPEAFGKACANFGFHVQARWYTNGMSEVTGKIYQFIFIAQEKAPPYAVAVYRADQEFLDAGATVIRPLLEIYAKCVETDTWPSYDDVIKDIELPGWAK